MTSGLDLSSGVGTDGGGVAAIQARMAQLQGLLGATLSAGTGIGTVTGTSGSSGGGFAGALSGSLTAAGGNPGQAAVSLARSYLGVPYRWGGTDPATGLDCSGLVQLVYRQLGVQLPRTSQQQEHAGTEVASLADAQPGDLVFFGEPAHHVGIYLGNGQMIDAPHTGSTVGVHQIAGYGPVSHLRRVLPAALPGALPSGSAANPSATGLLGTQSVSVAGTGGAATLTGPYADLFVQAGNRYGVDPALLSAVARAESGYDPRAVSGAGAQGLMQLMPGTARSLGVNPFDPGQAVDGAARLLAGNLSSFSGRVDLALAAYNAGPAAVNRYGGIPPFTQTRDYVQRVTSYWEALR